MARRRGRGRGYERTHPGGRAPAAHIGSVPAARSAGWHAARTLAVAPRVARHGRTRRLAARPGRRPRLAPACHRKKIRQTHRAPRLAPRRCLDALLQKINRSEVKEVKEVQDSEVHRSCESAACAPTFVFLYLLYLINLIYLIGLGHLQSLRRFSMGRGAQSNTRQLTHHARATIDAPT